MRHWADDPLSGKLWQQVGAELRSYFRPPFTVPVIVLINVILVLACWFLAGPDTLFHFTAVALLPIAIVSWSFSDVPATNIFGTTPEQTSKLIDQPAQLRRIFTVKNISLWVLISPACFITSLALTPTASRPAVSIAVAIGSATFPFAYLGLAAMVAPLLPYHPIPARERFKRRDTWLRWGLAIGVSYFALTAPAALLVLGPIWLLFQIFGTADTNFLLAAILMTPWSFAIWRMGLHLATKIARKRRDWLVAFLGDPQRG